MIRLNLSNDICSAKHLWEAIIRTLKTNSLSGKGMNFVASSARDVLSQWMR